MSNNITVKFVNECFLDYELEGYWEIDVGGFFNGVIYNEGNSRGWLVSYNNEVTRGFISYDAALSYFLSKVVVMTKAVTDISVSTSSLTEYNRAIKKLRDEVLSDKCNYNNISTSQLGKNENTERHISEMNAIYGKATVHTTEEDRTYFVKKVNDIVNEQIGSLNAVIDKDNCGNNIDVACDYLRNTASDILGLIEGNDVDKAPGYFLIPRNVVVEINRSNGETVDGVLSAFDLIESKNISEGISVLFNSINN